MRYCLTPGNSIFLLLGMLFNTIGHGQDLFSRTEPIAFSTMQKVQPTHSVGGYPLLNIGNDLGLMHLKVTNTSGTHLGSGVPLANAYMVDIRNGIFFAGIVVQANLSTSNATDWTDEPCKREDYLWKKSIGGRFRDINCVSMNHIVRYFAAPTGEYQQHRVYFMDKGIEFPPTVVRVIFTRHSSRERRLIYQVDINPEVFGVDRDSGTIWGSSSWHKKFVQRDVKKVEFVANLSKWAEDVQIRMEKAFDKDAAAFVGLPEFSSYFRKAPQPTTEQNYNEHAKAILSSK
jgi:hypothetical protein